MEHIGKVLDKLGQEIPTQNQKSIEPEPDITTPEERREELRKSLCVTTLSSTFENFRPVAGTERALAAFRALAEGKTHKKMLLCYGGVGNGKTYLCEATVIALYKRGLFCRVMTMTKMMRALEECMRPEALTSYEELLDRYCRCRYLIIDDVGMGGSGSEWEYGQLEEIIVFRYREQRKERG